MVITFFEWLRSQESIMNKNGRVSAIILAAGKGTRMNTNCPKQFIVMDERPILYYTIKSFEESSVDEILIVTSQAYIEYVQKEIIEQYGFGKVTGVVCGGNERYQSVYQGLLKLEHTEYVLVHDGARPFIQANLIDQLIAEVKSYEAAILGVRTKDTVKIVDETGYVVSTPDRNLLWNIQTPQAFAYDLLKSAYDKVIEDEVIGITDDAMVVEYATNHPIKVLEGSYRNIKITTIEDLKAESFQGL